MASIKNEQQFKEWLPKNNVTAIPSYMSYLNEAAQVAGYETVDDFFESVIESEIVEKLRDEDFSTKRDATNSRSAVRKYWDFLRHLGKDLEGK